MKIINKIKARFDKMARLEGELIQLNKKLEELITKEQWLNKVYLKSIGDEGSLKSENRKLLKDLEDIREELKISTKSLQNDLIKCQECNTKLRQELDKAVEDLESSRVSEKETKELLLETMKLNNALNTRVTRNEVSQPIDYKLTGWRNEI